MKKVVALAGLLLAASLGVLFYAKSRTRSPVAAEDFAHLPKPAVPGALFNAPPFSFTAHTEEVVTHETLRGRPYVANFIFTTCRTVCPLLTSKLVRLQRELPGVDVRFVSFSVDPSHDTPEVLAGYARAWNAEEARWLLLATADDSLAQLAEGFHVTAQKTDGGLDAVMHSPVFVLVDGAGVVRGIYDSDDSADFKALRQAVLHVAGAAERMAPPSRSGEELFHELSCNNCHAFDSLAPPLGGLKGRRRELQHGAVVTADAAYVKESLLLPSLKRVRGYPLMMPSYEGAMSKEELDALVAYVLALPDDTAHEANVELAIDPVCHMKVRADTSALKAEHDGGVTYFCSAFCLKRFQENPDAYR